MAEAACHFIQEKALSQINMQIKINFKIKTVPQNNAILSRPKKLNALVVERRSTAP
jgi:hypothetical protein